MSANDSKQDFLNVGPVAQTLRFMAHLEGITIPSLINRMVKVYARNVHPEFIVRSRTDGSPILTQVSRSGTVNRFSLPTRPPRRMNDPIEDTSEMKYDELLEHNANVAEKIEKAMAELGEKPMAPAPKPTRKWRNKPWPKNRSYVSPQQDNGGIPKSWGGRGR